MNSSTFRRLAAQTALLVVAAVGTIGLTEFVQPNVLMQLAAAGAPVDCRSEIYEQQSDGTYKKIEVGEQVTMVETEQGTIVQSKRPDKSLPAGKCKIQLIGMDGRPAGEHISEPLSGGGNTEQVSKGATEYEDPYHVSEPYVPPRLTPSETYYDPEIPLTDLSQLDGVNAAFNEPTPIEQLQPAQPTDFTQLISEESQAQPVEVTSETRWQHEPVSLDPSASRESGDSNRSFEVVGSENTTFDESGDLGEEQESRRISVAAVEYGADILPVEDLSADLNGDWPRTPASSEFKREVQETLARVQERQTYLSHLSDNDLCAASCVGAQIFNDNQERVLRSMIDVLERDYPAVVEGSQLAAWEQPAESVSPHEYYLKYTDAVGQTYFCDANGSCSSSETLTPHRSYAPIALSEAPREMVYMASHETQFTGGRVSYALVELENSFIQSIESMTQPIYRGLPRCSLFTSLTNSSCGGWYQT
ncbi:MAG: hypothetical protein RIQ56_71 [Candidatus Parcubacteria bacterium]|jgi:hypothetical protein